MKAFFNSLAQVGFFLLAVALLVFVIGLGTLVIIDVSQDKPISRIMTIHVSEMLDDCPELAVPIREAYRGDDAMTYREYLEIREAYKYLRHQNAIQRIRTAITPVC
jgi:hypothetical protein